MLRPNRGAAPESDVPEDHDLGPAEDPDRGDVVVHVVGHSADVLAG
jgi:hypothetical protein